MPPSIFCCAIDVAFYPQFSVQSLKKSAYLNVVISRVTIDIEKLWPLLLESATHRQISVIILASVINATNHRRRGLCCTLCSSTNYCSVHSNSYFLSSAIAYEQQDDVTASVWHDTVTMPATQLAIWGWLHYQQIEIQLYEISSISVSITQWHETISDSISTYASHKNHNS